MAPTHSSEDRSLVVVSSDAHVGPRLENELRGYCPAQHLEAFDAFAKSAVRGFDAIDAIRDRYVEGYWEQARRNQRTRGHYDFAARRRDMDRDGVSAEVVFHSSLNYEPIPFHGTAFVFDLESRSQRELELLGVGCRIYNRWLADAISDEPHRHIGLAQLPMNNVDLAIKELEWARDAGLGGVNFPVPRPGIVDYADPVWERFWAICAEAQMPLASHAGGTTTDRQWPQFELSSWQARRALYRLVFTGVFERYPTLRLVLTEQPGTWWEYTLREFDSAQQFNRDLARGAPRPASEYCKRNVFIGASFLARFEAEDAIASGYVDNVLWGSDYPHAEGTWEFCEDPSTEPRTRVALRNTFGGLDSSAVMGMIGLNACNVYGLDESYLAKVAKEINAPTIEAMSDRPGSIPREHFTLGFREFGPWS